MPDAPVTVDLSGNGGPWPGFTVSGLTGVSAVMNGTYLITGEMITGYPVWRKAGSAHFVWGDFDEAVTWRLNSDAETTNASAAAGSWPWNATGWTNVNSAQAPVFALVLAPPVSVTIEGADATVQASATTALAGAHANLKITAVYPGRLGNGVRFALVAPGTNNAALAVNVINSREIEVNLATNGVAVVTSTAALVKAAVEASPAASAIVALSYPAGNNGSGTIPSDTEVNYVLAGGTGGLPVPPVSVSL